MKTFFLMRRNPANKSGMSYKIWKIERVRRRVTAYWAPAKVVGRRVVAARRLSKKSWWSGTENAARRNEARRIAEQLAQGYERSPRTRSVA